MSQECTLLILRSKGQDHGAWLIVVIGFQTITESVINLWSWNFILLLPMNQECTLLILRSKGQGHGAWLIVVIGFRTITESVINLWSWHFKHLLPMSHFRMHPIDFEVKMSKLRSWGMVICKWLPEYNWLCNQPMIMKLHTLAPHESRMRSIDFEVKGQVHGAWSIVNDFRTCSVINLWSWNFIHLLPMNQGCALLILRSKGQGHGEWLIVNGFWTITDSVINLWS